MSGPEAAVLAWALAILGGEVTVERGLREGDSPWLIRARNASAVLRVAPLDSKERLAIEVAALRHAAGAGLPVPEASGAITARISAVAPGPPDALPGRSGPIADVPWVRLRQERGASTIRVSGLKCGLESVPKLLDGEPAVAAGDPQRFHHAVAILV